jgi:hypothetical protein
MKCSLVIPKFPYTGYELVDLVVLRLLVRRYWSLPYLPFLDWDILLNIHIRSKSFIEQIEAFKIGTGHNLLWEAIGLKDRTRSLEPMKDISRAREDGCTK